MTQDRQALLIVLSVAALLILSAFAAEATYRNRVCISAYTVDQAGATTFTPTECR